MPKTIEEIESRMKEIRSILESAEEVNLEELTAEVEGLEARKRELLEQIEQRNALVQSIAQGEGTVIESLEPVMEERNNMDIMEMRKTAEYGCAYAKAMLGADDTELRAFLSANSVSGSAPVPEVLDTEIRNAWENCQVMSLVKRTNYKGNVKVGFELSATGAVVHTEGTNAPEEETLVWGTVELKAESIKKWITVSDEAIDLSSIDVVSEIYKEVAQRIVEKAESIAIGKIISAPATSTSSACAVPVYEAATPAVDTITLATAEISGQARNLTAVMNRRTYAALKAAVKANKFAVDAFDGIPVVFTDALKASSAATAGETYIIVGDFGYGFQANFPSGNDITLKLDDMSLAEKDLVKIVGRQFVGMGVVAPKAFVKIAIPSA